MLNLFPIQFLAMFAYFILRIFIASILIYLGYKHFRNISELKNILKFSWFPFGVFSTTLLALAEIVFGLMLFVGVYTQIAALGIILMSVKMLIFHKLFIHKTVPSKIFYTLLIGASFSLFITGAGIFAFDLPL